MHVENMRLASSREVDISVHPSVDEITFPLAWSCLRNICDVRREAWNGSRVSLSMMSTARTCRETLLDEWL
jgi:hypothetical protein